MADCVAQRFCPLPPDIGLYRALQWLTQNGYQLSARSGLTAQLVHPGGPYPAPPRHRLVVAATEQRLDFTYQPASVFDSGPSMAEEARFGKLVDQLVQTLKGQPMPAAADPPRETSLFCPECGTRTEPGTTSCAMCGAKL